MYLRKDYMTEVSINEKMNVNNRNHKKYRYLAKTTTGSQFLLIAYILFLTKLQKGKPRKTDLPSWKTISQVLNPLLKCWIHSRNQKYG